MKLSYTLYRQEIAASNYCRCARWLRWYFLFVSFVLCASDNKKPLVIANNNNNNNNNNYNNNYNNNNYNNRDAKERSRSRSRRAATISTRLGNDNFLSQSSSANLLMIGNGYTATNGFEDTIKAFLEEDIMRNSILIDNNRDAVYAMRFERGSAKLEDYALPTDDECNDCNNIKMELKSVMLERDWNWVVLQEQSETPGLHDTKLENAFEKSLESVIELDKIIRKEGMEKDDNTKTAETILLLTWGRVGYDVYNSDIYPDFDTMQNKLNEGFRRYESGLKNSSNTNSNHVVKIAPAGLAFKYIHDSLLEEGTDPTEPGTEFHNLYAQNHSQGMPSNRGSYLAACVVYQTISGHDVRKLSHAPFGIDNNARDYLQNVAAITVDNYVSDYNSNNGIENNQNQQGNNGNNDDDGTSSTFSSPEYKPYLAQSSLPLLSDQSSKMTGKRFIFAFVLLFGGCIALFLGIHSWKQQRFPSFEFYQRKYNNNNKNIHYSVASLGTTANLEMSNLSTSSIS